MSSGWKRNVSAAARRSFLVAFPVAMAGGVIWFASQGSAALSWIPPCLVHEQFGVLCPGCGGSRALLCLLHGDIASSLAFNPLVLGLLVLSPAMVLGAASRHKSLQMTSTASSYVLLGLVFYAGVIRNVIGVEV